MELVKTLAETFALSLAATFAVALLARLGGSKPNWRNMLAIAIGLTLAQAIQLRWSLSPVAYALTLGVSVALCVLIAQRIGFTAKSEA
jgi:hypothetical protein